MPRSRPQRFRSARRIALRDQVQALLRDSSRCMTTAEIVERLGPGYHYADVYPILEALHQAELIEKFVHPALKKALWGAPGSTKGDLVVQYAQLSVHAMRLRDALLRAPAPGTGRDWAGLYVAWWSGLRKDVLT